jgi:hypothetical protein
MPTVGWILEDAVERFWENPYPPEHYVAPAIPCPYCQRHFTSSCELFDHLGLNHPLGIPVLMVQSQTMPSEFSIRTVLEAADISALNCTSSEIRKNGGAWRSLPFSRMVALLAAERSSTCELRLVNERVIDDNRATEHFTARFRIPSADALNGIDKAFVRRLAVEHPRMADVDSFRTVCPNEAAAQDYASALGDYVIGVAIKERHPDAGAYLEFEHYKGKFTAALAVLEDFHRPVARTVSAVINFNLNNFRSPPIASRLPVLNAAFVLFRAVAKCKEPPAHSLVAEPQRADVCPVDIFTHRILSAAQRLMSSRKPHPMLGDELDELAGRQPLSEFDAAKIHVLAAIARLRLGDAAEAERHLRALQFDYLFRSWALEKLDQHFPHGESDTR